MLLTGACALSAGVSLVLWGLGVLPGPGWLPAAFALGVLAALLLWALSCLACTWTVDKGKPCRRRSRLFGFYAACILDTTRQLLRVKLHVSGLEKLPQGCFLLVSNHRSALDPLLEMWAFRRQHLGFVAKQELFRIPVVGRLMHRCLCLSLDRGSPREGLKVIHQAAELIRSGQAAMGIYPEGTRSRDGQLLPFQNGAFRIAQKAGCPIVVAVIRNSDRVLKRFSPRRKDIYLEVVQVIPAEEAAQRKTVQLGHQVHLLMEQALGQAQAEPA